MQEVIIWTNKSDVLSDTETVKEELEFHLNSEQLNEDEIQMIEDEISRISAGNYIPMVYSESLHPLIKYIYLDMIDTYASQVIDDFENIILELQDHFIDFVVTSSKSTSKGVSYESPKFVNDLLDELIDLTRYDSTLGVYETGDLVFTCSNGAKLPKDKISYFYIIKAFKEDVDNWEYNPEHENSIDDIPDEVTRMIGEESDNVIEKYCKIFKSLDTN